MSPHDSAQPPPRNTRIETARAGDIRRSLQQFWLADDYAALLRRHGLGSFEALFDYRDGERLDKLGLASWRERWRIRLRDDDRDWVFYLKRFVKPPRTAQREVRRSGSRAQSVAGNEWAWIQRVSAEGIPCSLPVAFGEDVRRGREMRSALLTLAAPGQSLERWAADAVHGVDAAQVRSLVDATAKLVARLHAAGLFHRDLYLSHLFFDADSGALRLIDLQRVLHPTWRLMRWRVKDLAALNYSTPRPLVSGADRLRWLRTYLGAARLGPDGKRLAYRILGKTLQIARRDRRIASRRLA